MVPMAYVWLLKAERDAKRKVKVPEKPGRIFDF